MLWSICVLLAPVITDRIVVACYRAASVGRIKSVKRHPSSEVRIKTTDLYVRVPASARQVGQFVPTFFFSTASDRTLLAANILHQELELFSGPPGQNQLVLLMICTAALVFSHIESKKHGLNLLEITTFLILEV